jgi:DNA-binding transcriptional ArsR family regulator
MNSVRQTISLGVDDLAATRFAVSPLAETVFALQLLRTGDAGPLNLPWLRWARHDLARRPLSLPLLWPLLRGVMHSRPEFLTPAPVSRAPSFEEEAERMRATPPGYLCASLERVFGHRDQDPWPDSARELAARPGQTLELIAGELAAAHTRLIAPHWDRMRAVLDADIAYRGGVLARSGAAVLFAGLHPGVRWAAGELTVSGNRHGPRESQVTPGPAGGLVLVPSVLIWPGTTVKWYSSSQTTLRYPARGAATVWEQTGWEQSLPPNATSQALRDLLGAPRARLLEALRSPASTAALARALNVSSSAVSQHLSVLRRCGLLDRTRSGREMLYQTSDLGLTLLGSPALASQALEPTQSPSRTRALRRSL